jgi:hypothetical protein
MSLLIIGNALIGERIGINGLACPHEVCGKGDTALTEAYLTRLWPATTADKSSMWFKSGTLAFNPSGALGKEAALKWGCPVRNLG